LDGCMAADSEENGGEEGCFVVGETDNYGDKWIPSIPIMAETHNASSQPTRHHVVKLELAAFATQHSANSKYCLPICPALQSSQGHGYRSIGLRRVRLKVDDWVHRLCHVAACDAGSAGNRFTIATIKPPSLTARIDSFVVFVSSSSNSPLCGSLVLELCSDFRLHGFSTAIVLMLVRDR